MLLNVMVLVTAVICLSHRILLCSLCCLKTDKVKDKNFNLDFNQRETLNIQNAILDTAIYISIRADSILCSLLICSCTFTYNLAGVEDIQLCFNTIYFSYCVSPPQHRTARAKNSHKSANPSNSTCLLYTSRCV